MVLTDHRHRVEGFENPAVCTGNRVEVGIPYGMGRDDFFDFPTDRANQTGNQKTLRTGRVGGPFSIVLLRNI
jgi:hypothetical protein